MSSPLFRATDMSERREIVEAYRNHTRLHSPLSTTPTIAELMSSQDANARHEKTRFRSWPITETAKLEPKLRAMGLKVPAAKIDGTSNSSGASGGALSDALVSVGPAGRGGTGSFISGTGLVITNHHVAHEAVRLASKDGNDYIEDGFVARTAAEELMCPDYEVWITRNCTDVSAAVLEVAQAVSDPLERANKVRDKKLELATAKEQELADNAGMRCEVKEMFTAKTYVLFTFQRLRDVRIVYVPPKSLGNFGGDADNFEWPRHTADFTLLRAYVAPDGSAAEPAAENVPFQPTKHLVANKQGARDGDFVFLLGFPGHTMRYAPTSRLAYADTVSVPSLLTDFGRKLELFSQYKDEPDVMLKICGSQKSLANEFKRSSGKRVMMRKLGLLAERAAEEELLRTKAPRAAAVLGRLEELYDQLKLTATRDDALGALRGVYAGSALLLTGHKLFEASVECAKPDEERQPEYRERNQPFVLKQVVKKLHDLHIPLERQLVADAVAQAGPLAFDGAAPALEALLKWAEGETASSTLHETTEEDIKTFLLGASTLPDSDPFVAAAAALYSHHVAARDNQKTILSERDQLLAELGDIWKECSDEESYPDANSTLRISAGHVEGYQAADAVVHTPITTLAGVVDKHLEHQLCGTDSEGQFDCPERLVAACDDATVRKTPVNLLYSTDTVGGNSGSPVMNAEGLMNEYKWSHQYSRSIGVDVRYILWLVGSYDDAMYLVDEMTTPVASQAAL